MELERAAVALADIAPVRRDESMARHTTFGVGGPADLYLVATNADQLARAFVVARRHGLPVFVLGSGSNILVGDKGVRGLVIKNDAKAVSEPEATADGRARVVAESGASFASLARRLCKAGFSGLEWAVGIPGTVGGAVVYNAGAYDGCLADVLERVRVVDAGGCISALDADELRLAYRESAFTRGLLRDRVLLDADFHVTLADAARVLAKVAALDGKRLAAQPRGRNAGSMFKNPPGAAAWQLIDQVGLRGWRIGDAEISAKHTNFFMNHGNATAAEVRQLIDLAASRVRERFGIELHTEVLQVGEF